MRSLRALALILAVSAAAPAHGEVLPAEQVISAVEATYRDVTAIEAQFTQTVASSTLGESVQKGRLQLQRPKRARWEFTEPQKSAMITNGQTMWIWSPDENQVIVTQDLSGSSSGSGSDLMVLLTDLSRIDEFFTVEVGAGAEDVHVLKLTPRDEGLRAQLSGLELVMARDGMLLRRLSFADSFGQKTSLVFSGVQLNPTLPASQFDFTPPDGATIIDSGGL
ncbi:MAG: outer membrane lipoprotein carrier protein [Myxococcota bacterium]|jgi:outer membrane lipoprotein carrier protein